MAIDKKSITGLGESLPESATMDDLIDETYVRLQIEEGLREREAGLSISDEELQRRMSKWLSS